MCCVHGKWECGREVLHPPSPSKSSWDAHASSASQTRSIFSQEEEERLNYLQPLDERAAALVKKSFQLIDFSPWQPSQPEHSHQHLLAPPPFAITFSSCVLRYRKNLPSSIWKCVRCVPSYCSTRYVHVLLCMYVYTAHTQDGLADPPLHLHGGGGMAGDGAEVSLPDFNLHPRKVRKCEDGDLDRSAVVSSPLPICLLLRESRKSGFASKGPPRCRGGQQRREKKVCDHSRSQLRT